LFPVVRINVRIEHVSPSKCRDDHIARVKYNDATRRACQKAGKPVPCLKRRPAGPKPAHYVNITRKPPTFLTPIPYQFVV
jgi:large subunit ribosomal protein L21e